MREHELCPVFTAIAAGQVEADPAEVAAIEWAPWSEFRDDVLARRRDVSPWCIEQVAALVEREEAGGRFTTAAPAELPGCARLADRRRGRASGP